MGMSDFEELAKMSETAGPVGLAGAGLVAVGWIANKLFGPTAEEAGIRLRDAIFERERQNVARTLNRADATAEAHGLATEGVFPHPRVAKRVLNDASMYDDDVQQTYVAGLLAGSRNDDGSDDRPIYYLTVLDGLSADQLRVFHILYAAVEQRFSTLVSSQGPTVEEVPVLLTDVDAMLELFPQPQRDITMSVLFQLEHAGLITNLHTGNNAENRPTIWFMATRVGALLYDWAHGFSDEEIRDFGRRERPDIGLPTYSFDRSMWS